MVCLRRIAWLLCFGVVLSTPIAAQRQLVPLTPTAAALQLSSELDKDSHEYEGAIQAIVSSYLTAGDYESAFKTLSVLNPPEQALQLHFVSVFATREGHKEETRTALNRFLKLVTDHPDDSQETGLIGEFAERAIALGDLALASRFVAAITEDPVPKTEALSSIARAHLKQGEKDAAAVALDAAVTQLKILQSENQYQFLRLVSPLAKLLVEAGNREGAIELANLADQTSLPEGDPNAERIKGFRSAAFVSLGNFERALAITESQEGELKGEGLITLALAYGESGKTEAALSSMRYASAEASESDDLLSQIVTAYLKLGRPDDAFVVLRQMKTPYTLVGSAIKLSRAYQAINRSQEAVAALDVASAETRKLVSEKSEDIPSIASFSIAREKSMSLSSLGEAYLEIGYLRGAEQCANAIDQPQHKASLLTLVASAYRKNGDQLKARSLLKKAFSLSAKAEQYNHDMWRSEALLQIAEAYADAGLKSEAGEVALRFLSELRRDENGSSTISGLINIGRVCEKSGIPLDKSAQSLLRKIVAQYRENN